MAYHINHANIKDWAKNYDGPLFDGILCDPPYELGFMGKSWDSTGIAFNVELWTELLRICKPGAHLLAFSGSRTYHRMAVAIEDAGFEIRDMIEWVYGSGFPKSLNIGKAVDKINAKDYETCLKFTDYLISKKGNYSNADIDKLLGLSNGAFHFFAKSQSNNAIPRKEHYLKLKEILSLDDEWDWYIEEAEREIVGKKSNQMQGWSMDGTTQFVDRNITVPKTEQAKLYEGYGTALKPAHEPCVLARKPIEGTVANNVLKHGTGGLNIDGTRIATKEQWLGRELPNAQDGVTWGGDLNSSSSSSHELGRFPANLIHDGSDEVEAVFPNESSRFFYTAKASKSERNAGLEGFDEKPATTRMNASMVRMENGMATNDRAGQSVNANHHPTVKPLSLTKYLATLIKPPTGGRLLVPFSGSGSEMIGALQAGWEYVEGVELTEEYIPIAEARIKHWLDKIDKQMGML